MGLSHNWASPFFIFPIVASVHAMMNGVMGVVDDPIIA